MSEEKVVVVIDDLTLGEAEDFEEVSGTALAGAEKGLTAKAMRTLVWITLRRTNPDIAFDECKSYKMADVEWAAARPTKGDS